MLINNHAGELPPATVDGSNINQQLRLALTAKEAARALGVSTRTLSRLGERGLLRSSKALRTKLYAVTEINRFLEETK